MYKGVMKILCLNLIILLTFVSCQGKRKLIEVKGETMGTYYRVKSFTDVEPAELKQDLDKLLVLFNKIFSTYIKDSELSKINSSKFQRFELSKPLQKVMTLALDINKKSGGYFDVTVGPLVNAWGFGPDGKQKQPTAQEIKTLLEQSGSQYLSLEDKILRTKKEGLYIDLSAIAKGFAVDEMIKFLEFKGHKNLLVEIGGEVRTSGTKPDGSNWKLGIEGPSENLGSKISKVIELKNMSLATSGSYRNYIKYGDKVFSHTIDPKSGYPSEHKTVSVSVLSEYCADADAWATALMSMGAEKGIEIANNLDIAAYFQVKNNDKIDIIMSRKFIKYTSSK